MTQRVSHRTSDEARSDSADPVELLGEHLGLFVGHPPRELSEAAVLDLVIQMRREHDALPPPKTPFRLSHGCDSAAYANMIRDSYDLASFPGFGPRTEAAFLRWLADNRRARDAALRELGYEVVDGLVTEIAR